MDCPAEIDRTVNEDLLSYDDILTMLNQWMKSADFKGKKFGYFVPPEQGKTLGVRVLHENNGAHFTYRIDRWLRRPMLDLD